MKNQSSLIAIISIITIVTVLLSGCSSTSISATKKNSAKNNGSITTINFWNGNKSAARQSFEQALLEASLKATAEDQGAWQLNINNDNYSSEEESNVFDNENIDIDVLVTVAGNKKFDNKSKLIINQPLVKGLLGYRLLLVRDDSLKQFESIQQASELQALSIGIPQSWADADLFRHNNYKVIEKGDFDQLFINLKQGDFDYTALGANEIELAFQQRIKPVGNISIEPSIILYYPFPLVFYVSTNKQDLYQRLSKGLALIMDNGVYETIFIEHHGNIVERLKLNQRKFFTLKNPNLPISMRHFKPTLLK